MLNFSTIINVAVLIATASIALAQTTIDPSEGQHHVGESVRVQFVVQATARAGDQLVLYSRRSWRDDDCFIVRLTPTVQDALESKGTKLPEDLVDRSISANGLVQTVAPGGMTRPVIIASSLANFRVLDTQEPKPPTAASEIEPEQALDFIGKSVRVRLTVASIGRNGETQNLNSGESWDAPGNLQIKLPPPIVAEYEKQDIDNPAVHFLRKNIEVTGIIHETRPGGKRVAAITLQATDNLSFVLKASREAIRISQLVNRRIDLHLKDGKKYGNALVVEVNAGESTESIASLKVKIGDAKPRVYRAISIDDVSVDGASLDLSYDRKSRTLMVDEERRNQRIAKESVVERQVLAKGKRLWPRLNDNEHAQWISKHREFLETVRSTFPELPLRVVETDYFLILTDIPDAEARKYLGYLDTLYHQMCRAFAIPQGSNIWCGKCIIVAFQNRADFIRFELDVINNKKGDPTKSGGICHASSDGRVVISLFKGDFEDRFATVLVHETSHGIVARFLSDVRIPSWLNEGMAVWVAKFVVKSDNTLERHEQKAIATLRQQRSLAGFFHAPQIPGDLYGSASAIVNLLLRSDAVKFREFFVLIKQGVDQSDALKQAYNMTFADVARLYGSRIGLPNLQP